MQQRPVFGCMNNSSKRVHQDDTPVAVKMHLYTRVFEKQYAMVEHRRWSDDIDSGLTLN